MKVIAKAGKDDLATVFIAKDDKGRIVEFAQSLTPPFTREEKWVFLISSSYGCPVKCKFCDAGTYYCGNLSVDEILFEIDFLLNYYKAETFMCNKLKIQFARVGEPSFNPNVLKVLDMLSDRIQNHKLYPSISTVAPKSQMSFFEELKKIKKAKYPYTFQLQFSIHSTDEDFRYGLMPVEKLTLLEISKYGEKFYDKDGRKITLNFVYNPSFPIELDIILNTFDPEKFLIKITPVNPTVKSIENSILADFKYEDDVWFKKLEKKGFEVLISIGELEENKIGSNCGQYINYFRNKKLNLKESYTYELTYL